ncbi:MAG: efflux RND transporter periplasmic adaptor subunit [Verrucomicrobia bacterium]|nr:efflux RND transporter periplasmic adaptor subunit [Verrucomicrobiota bacterium]
MKRSLILGIAVTLAGCSDKTLQQEFVPPPVPVQTADVEVRDVPLFIEAMGVIKPSTTAVVMPQVFGMIKEVHFSEGQWVEEGDLLYTLDDAPYAIRVLELEAQRDQDLAHLNNARKKLERYKSLTKQDLIAKVEWDELETKVALHEAMVKADEARLLNAKLDLQHCKIKAPIAGLAGKSALDTGNMASGTPLVSLTQTDPLFVDFSITEKELLQIASPSAVIKVYAAGNEECLGLGKVTFMDHSIDPQSGMLAATGRLAKEHKPLWPGQSVRVHLYFGKKENAMLIPMRAIRTNQEGPYIFAVKEDNTVEVRSVKLGPEEKGQIVVESGLEGASKVVTEGQLRLFPGSKIEEIR